MRCLVLFKFHLYKKLISDLLSSAILKVEISRFAVFKEILWTHHD